VDELDFGQGEQILEKGESVLIGGELIAKLENRF